jgi:hypothetical protein
MLHYATYKPNYDSKTHRSGEDPPKNFSEFKVGTPTNAKTGNREIAAIAIIPLAEATISFEILKPFN